MSFRVFLFRFFGCFSVAGFSLVSIHASYVGSFKMESDSKATKFQSGFLLLLKKLLPPVSTRDSTPQIPWDYIFISAQCTQKSRNIQKLSLSKNAMNWRGLSFLNPRYHLSLPSDPSKRRLHKMLAHFCRRISVAPAQHCQEGEGGSCKAGGLFPAVKLSLQEIMVLKWHKMTPDFLIGYIYIIYIYETYRVLKYFQLFCFFKVIIFCWMQYPGSFSNFPMVCRIVVLFSSPFQKDIFHRPNRSQNAYDLLLWN